MASEHRLFGAANHKPGSSVALTGRFLERGNRGVILSRIVPTDYVIEILETARSYT